LEQNMFCMTGRTECCIWGKFDFLFCERYGVGYIRS